MTQIDPNELIDTTGVSWQDGLAAAAVIVAAIVVSRIVKKTVTAALGRFPNLQAGLAVFTGRVAGWFVILLGIVFALVFVGFAAGPLFLIVGIVLAVVVISGRPVIENLGSSFVLQARSPFTIGDEVAIEGHIGIVLDIDSRVTLIETLDGKHVFVPNSTVLAHPIVNHTALGHRRTSLEIGVEYGTDLDAALGVVVRVLSATPGVSTDPAPAVFVSEFADSAIVLTVWLWHGPRTVDAFAATDAALRGISRTFAETGIVVAFPQRVVWHRYEGGEGPEQ